MAGFGARVLVLDPYIDATALPAAVRGRSS
jgi:hypothetical protein